MNPSSPFTSLSSVKNVGEITNGLAGVTQLPWPVLHGFEIYPEQCVIPFVDWHCFSELAML